MWTNIILTALSGLLLMAALFLAGRLGRKKEQVAALKKEIKKMFLEQEKANAINNRVDNMSVDDVHKRLSNTKSK